MKQLVFLICALLISCEKKEVSLTKTDLAPKEIAISSSLLMTSSSLNFSSSSIHISSSNLSSTIDSSGICIACNSFPPSAPTLHQNGGSGSVTSYGSIIEQETSQGGACNYGETNIQYYAAVHVHQNSGDNLGPWNNGLACGACVSVKVKTPTGWKKTIVRITDKCPDEYCGIDLGGAPTLDLMGKEVGRYEGEWEFVPCKGIKNVYGDSTSIYTKEGTNSFWSVIQVRNPPDALKSITLVNLKDSTTYNLELAIEAENYWGVPSDVLQSEDSFSITVTYRSGEPDTWILTGNQLAQEQETYYLQNKNR